MKDDGRQTIKILNFFFVYLILEDEVIVKLVNFFCKRLNWLVDLVFISSATVKFKSLFFCLPFPLLSRLTF